MCMSHICGAQISSFENCGSALHFAPQTNAGKCGGAFLLAASVISVVLQLSLTANRLSFTSSTSLGSRIQRPPLLCVVDEVKLT
jgi:hypothetical protein